MVSVLATARSGSTNLSNYLSYVLGMKLVISPFEFQQDISILENDKLYKILIHQQAKGYDSLFGFGEDIITKSDKVVLLDREDKTAQAESLVFRKQKYGNDFYKYHIRENYGELSKEFVTESKFHFTEHHLALKQLSEKYNIPLFTYEQIYYRDGLKQLSDYLEI